MKKLYTIMVVLAGLFCYTGCTTDRDDNPILLKPTTFVLNTPAYVSGVYDLKNTETVLFTCSQPDYGFTAAVSYQVQVSMTSNFAEYEELNTLFTSVYIEANAADIALAMTNLLEDEYDEDNFPEDKLFTVYFRLSAKLTGTTQEAIYSNIIELPQVKSYFALPSVELPTTMYIVGNVVGDGWDWDTALSMVPVHSNPGKFWRIQYLGLNDDGNNAAVKFNATKSWDGAAGINANINAASTSKADVSGDGDGNIVIGNPGWYLVVVTVTLEGRDYVYDIELLDPNVYIIGKVLTLGDGDDDGVWSGESQYQFAVPEGKDDEFVSPLFPYATSEFRMCIILDGIDWWKTEFMVFEDKIEYRGVNTDQARVSVTAGERAYLNFTAGTGEIK